MYENGIFLCTFEFDRVGCEAINNGVICQDLNGKTGCMHRLYVADPARAQDIAEVNSTLVRAERDVKNMKKYIQEQIETIGRSGK